MQSCSEVFVLLMQIRRAKGVLERILVRGAGESQSYREEMKVFYAMRSRLSWFVKYVLLLVSLWKCADELLPSPSQHAAYFLDYLRDSGGDRQVS